jgi:hypothetical protein
MIAGIWSRTRVAQYGELASALVQMGAGWVVAEVEQIVSRGKTVPFRDLSEEESAQYESRLTEEVSRGLPVGRAKASDSIGAPYEPYERLALLVDAVERVVTTSELSYFYISTFAARLGVSSLKLESPIVAYTAADVVGAREIPLTAPTLVKERLAILRHVLNDEVLG